MLLLLLLNVIHYVVVEDEQKKEEQRSKTRSWIVGECTKQLVTELGATRDLVPSTVSLGTFILYQHNYSSRVAARSSSSTTSTAGGDIHPLLYFCYINGREDDDDAMEVGVAGGG